MNPSCVYKYKQWKWKTINAHNEFAFPAAALHLFSYWKHHSYKYFVHSYFAYTALINASPIILKNKKKISTWNIARNEWNKKQERKIMVINKYLMKDNQRWFFWRRKTQNKEREEKKKCWMDFGQSLSSFLLKRREEKKIKTINNLFVKRIIECVESCIVSHSHCHCYC